MNRLRKEEGAAKDSGVVRCLKVDHNEVPQLLVVLVLSTKEDQLFVVECCHIRANPLDQFGSWQLNLLPELAELLSLLVFETLDIRKDAVLVVGATDAVDVGA